MFSKAYWNTFFYIILSNEKHVIDKRPKCYLLCTLKYVVFLYREIFEKYLVNKIYLENHLIKLNNISFWWAKVTNFQSTTLNCGNFGPNSAFRCPKKQGPTRHRPMANQILNNAYWAFLWFMKIAWEYAYIYASIGINLCICIYLCFSDNILSKA